MLLLIFLIGIFLFVFVGIMLPHALYLVSKIRDNIDDKENNSVRSKLDDEYLCTPVAVICIVGYIAIAIAYICCAVWFIKVSNGPYKYSEEMQHKRTNIEYKLSYYDKLFYDYIEEAREYNKEVDSSNNKMVRFKIEDRSEYKINIDYYIAEFYNNKTTTS